MLPAETSARLLDVPLGVPATLTAVERWQERVRKAWKDKAKTAHPDRVPEEEREEATRRFQALGVALDHLLALRRDDDHTWYDPKSRMFIEYLAGVWHDVTVKPEPKTKPKTRPRSTPPPPPPGPPPHLIYRNSQQISGGALYMHLRSRAGRSFQSVSNSETRSETHETRPGQGGTTRPHTKVWTR